MSISVVICTGACPRWGSLSASACWCCNLLMPKQEREQSNSDCSQSVVSDMLWPLLSFRPSHKVSLYSPNWLQTHHPTASKSAGITGMCLLTCSAESQLFLGVHVWWDYMVFSFLAWLLSHTDIQFLLHHCKWWRSKFLKAHLEPGGMVLVHLPCLILFPLLQLVLLFTYAVLLTCRAHQAQHVCQLCVDAVLLFAWVHLILHGLAWLFTPWDDFPWTPLPK